MPPYEVGAVIVITTVLAKIQTQKLHQTGMGRHCDHGVDLPVNSAFLLLKGLTNEKGKKPTIITQPTKRARPANAGRQLSLAVKAFPPRETIRHSTARRPLAGSAAQKPHCWPGYIAPRLASPRHGAPSLSDLWVSIRSAQSACASAYSLERKGVPNRRANYIYVRQSTQYRQAVGVQTDCALITTDHRS